MADYVHYRRPIRSGVESFAPTHIHKAGLFVVGDVQQTDGSKQLHVLAPWIEGAYSSDGKKSPSLAKGSVDLSKHQPDAEEMAEIKKQANGKTRKKEWVDEAIGKITLWNAAVGEVCEETGIDLNRIRNPHNPQQEEPEDGFYPGVEIESLSQRPVFIGELPSNRGFAKNHMMFVVKVKGIEKLEPYLKHKEHNADMGSGSVSVTSKEAAKDADFYMFDDLLPILRSGKWTIPLEPRGLKGNEEIYQSKFDEIEREYAKLKGFKKPKKFQVSTGAEMDDLFQSVSVESQREIKDYLSNLRKFMDEHGLVKDSEGLKFGDKHKPLRYYQEGADIMPMDAWIQRMIDFAEENERYRDTQFNPNVLHVEVNKRGKVTEVPETCMSMAKMAFKVAVSLDEARAKRAHYIEVHPDRAEPADTWPTTVIDTDSTLREDIRKLEGEVREAYHGGHDRVVA